MNPLSNVRFIKELNEREIKLGINPKTSWHHQYKDSAWIFIGGLPFSLTEGDVICVFSQYGEIVNLNLIRDKKSGQSKGYAFLCYEDQRSTILAVDNLNGIKLTGRTIRVDHVAKYRMPKDHPDLDEVTRELRERGCGPATVKIEDDDDDDDVVEIKFKPKKEHKKSKKAKNEKKKKKHKRKSNSSSSNSSSEDELESGKRRKLDIVVKKEKPDDYKSVTKTAGGSSSSSKRTEKRDSHPKQLKQKFSNSDCSDDEAANHKRMYEARKKLNNPKAKPRDMNEKSRCYSDSSDDDRHKRKANETYDEGKQSNSHRSRIERNESNYKKTNRTGSSSSDRNDDDRRRERDERRNESEYRKKYSKDTHRDDRRHRDSSRNRRR